MPYETILFDAADGVATITLNRPENYNAMTAQMYEDLLDAFKQISRDNTVRVVVITGAGKGFCSGADLMQMQGRLQELVEIGDVLRQGLNRIALTIHQLEKPVICAINGVVAGAASGGRARERYARRASRSERHDGSGADVEARNANARNIQRRDQNRI